MFRLAPIRSFPSRGKMDARAGIERRQRPRTPVQSFFLFHGFFLSFQTAKKALPVCRIYTSTGLLYKLQNGYCFRKQSGRTAHKEFPPSVSQMKIICSRPINNKIMIPRKNVAVNKKRPGKSRASRLKLRDPFQHIRRHFTLSTLIERNRLLRYVQHKRHFFLRIALLAPLDSQRNTGQAFFLFWHDVFTLLDGFLRRPAQTACLSDTRQRWLP